MYSIPQQAVTNGYWKMENFRAQPIASSRRLVTNPASPGISLPVKSAIVPRVKEPYHEDPQKDHHVCQAPAAKATVDHGPGVNENELHVEQDEQDGDQVELDRQAADRQRKGGLPALEGLRFHGRRLLRTEYGCQHDVRRSESRKRSMPAAVPGALAARPR